MCSSDLLEVFGQQCDHCGGRGLNIHMDAAHAPKDKAGKEKAGKSKKGKGAGDGSQAQDDAPELQSASV